MWKYLKKYIVLGVVAAVFMVGEVLMDLFQPSFMSSVIDDGVLGANAAGGTGNLEVIAHMGGLMVLCAFVGAACGSANNVFANMCIKSFGNALRKDAFSRIMEMSFAQVERFGTGSLITRITNDISHVERYVEIFIRSIVRTGLLVVGSIYFMFRLNATFGFIILCFFPVAVAVLLVMLRVVTPLFTSMQVQLDELNAVMQEDLLGIRTIKACVRGAYEKARFGSVNATYTTTQLKALTIFAFLSPAMNGLMYVVIAILLWVGNIQAAQGAISAGVIVASISYATQLLNSILHIVMLSQDVSRGSASWTRLKEVLGCEPAIVGGTRQVPEGAGRIEFRDVDFSFPGQEGLALQGVNLVIEPGQTLAIMGATGCGKTALASLVPRFYDVTAGSVLLDGVDVREYPLDDLRKRVSCALQKSELFAEPVAQNIGWGAPDASEEEVAKALEVAQAFEFVERLPQGVQTVVAERGMSLSGGQRQRLSLARAVLKPAEVLILDDATSALDLACEASFHDALAQERPAQTKILVAQRIASVRNASKILVLEEGRVEACGTHEELLKTSPTYRDIYSSQFGDDSLATKDGGR